jgi:hypothetical protein
MQTYNEMRKEIVRRMNESNAHLKAKLQMKRREHGCHDPLRQQRAIVQLKVEEAARLPATTSLAVAT